VLPLIPIRHLPTGWWCC